MNGQNDRPDIIETKEFTYKDFILAMRELTVEMRAMRNEITRFNLFIASISQKAGNIGVVKSLIETFIGATSSGRKK